jgi:hypothetical protein
VQASRSQPLALKDSLNLRDMPLSAFAVWRG